MPLPFPEYDSLDGLGVAELVRQKHISPGEVLDAALARIDARNPALNAVVRRLDAEARAQLGALDQLPAEAPFRGVPMLIKDLQASIAGQPTSHGGHLLKDRPIDHDSELVARYRRAGAIFVGKSNTPEFGLTPFTEPEALGPARNPWDPTRTPGGSSGGSGAAVAARIVPIGHGGDGGGSIRIPASCNGLFGLKPTRGRTPTGPDLSNVWSGFAQEHVLTRSVRDSAAMLDATAGEDPGPSLACPAQARPYRDEVTTPPGTLRVLATLQPFFGRTVHPDCRAAFDDAVTLLRSLGHEVVQGMLPVDGAALARSFLTIVAAEARADIEWAAGVLGRKPRFGDVQADTWALGLLGRHFTAADYANAQRALQVATRTIGRVMLDYDVIVTPTLGAPPFVIGALQPSAAEHAALTVIGRLGAGGALSMGGMLDQMIDKAFGFIPFTPLFNCTGQPAMSVPLWWNAQGLPVGTQVVGRFGDEATLFRLAAQLEAARPWAGRVPPGVAS